MKRLVLSSFILLSALIALPAAQMRVVPLDEERAIQAERERDAAHARIVELEVVCGQC